MKARIARLDAGTLCVHVRGRLVGYVDVAPLSPSRYELHRSAAARDEDLRSWWIGTRVQPRPTCSYVGSTIVSQRFRVDAHERAEAVATHLRGGLRAFLAANSRFPARVLGIAATEAGRCCRRRGARPPRGVPAARHSAAPLEKSRKSPISMAVNRPE